MKLCPKCNQPFKAAEFVGGYGWCVGCHNREIESQIMKPPQKFLLPTILFVVVLFGVLLGGYLIEEQTYEAQATQAVAEMEEELTGFRRLRDRRQADEPEILIDENGETIEEEPRRRKRRRLLDPDRPRIFDGGRIKGFGVALIWLAGGLVALAMAIGFLKSKITR